MRKLPPLRLAFPCPCCHAMDGGGVLARIEFPDGTRTFLCDECELCFLESIHPAEFKFSDQLDPDALAARHGWSLIEFLRLHPPCWVLPLTISVEELMRDVNRAVSQGQVFAQGYAGPYQELETGRALNTRGDTVLVVEDGGTELLAYPAPRLVR